MKRKPITITPEFVEELPANDYSHLPTDEKLNIPIEKRAVYETRLRLERLLAEWEESQKEMPQILKTFSYELLAIVSEMMANFMYRSSSRLNKKILNNSIFLEKAIQLLAILAADGLLLGNQDGMTRDQILAIFHPDLNTKDIINLNKKRAQLSNALNDIRELVLSPRIVSRYKFEKGKKLLRLAEITSNKKRVVVEQSVAKASAGRRGCFTEKRPTGTDLVPPLDIPNELDLKSLFSENTRVDRMLRELIGNPE